MALIDNINDGFKQLTTLIKGKVNKTDVIAVAQGGTGATTLTEAQTSLGVDKVVSANTRLTTAKQTFPNVYVDSNGQLQKTQFATWLDHAKMYNGLVPNGSFQMGDATGWKLETNGLLTRDTTDFPFGAQACLRCSGSAEVRLELDKIAVNPYMKYRLSGMFKYERNTSVGEGFYAGYASYDVDNNKIVFGNVYHIDGTLTTLARDLKVGDTVVYLTSTKNWNTPIAAPSQNFRGIKFYNYTDSRGYLYQPEIMPYTRYISTTSMWSSEAAVNTTSNTITLNKGWNYPNPNDPNGIWRAGTKVARSNSQPITANWVLKNQWLKGKTGITDWEYESKEISGLALTPADDGVKFRPGTAFIAPSFAFNVQAGTAATGDVTKVSNLYLEKI